MSFTYDRPYHPEGRPDDKLIAEQEVIGNYRWQCWQAPDGNAMLGLYATDGRLAFGTGHDRLVNTPQPIDWSKPVRFKGEPEIPVLANDKPHLDGEYYATWKLNGIIDGGWFDRLGAGLRYKAKGRQLENVP